MTVENTGFAVALAQTAPDLWVWRVLDTQGDPAAFGETAREDVAREQAEFFRRSLERLSRRR